MCHGEIVDQRVDVFGGHSLVDMCRHVVKHGGIDLGTLPDTFYLFCIFNDFPGRNDVSLTTIVFQFFLDFRGKFLFVLVK